MIHNIWDLEGKSRFDPINDEDSRLAKEVGVAEAECKLLLNHLVEPG